MHSQARAQAERRSTRSGWRERQSSRSRSPSRQRCLHLHANPLLALDNANPPMLDRRVLPQVLARRSIAKITFEHQGRDFRLTDVGGKIVEGLLA